MYKIISPALSKRLSDGAFIAHDPQNRDYQELLRWLAQGNVPTPADPPPPTDTRRETARAACDDVVNEPGIPPKLKQFAQALKEVL